MAYLRCTQCGSKALVAASRCPRCAHPFLLVDARGDRVKLKQCRGCGIMHRVDTSCHWCGDIKSPWRFAGATWHRAAALAVMLVGAGTVWRVAPTVVQYTTIAVREARPQSEAPAARPVAITPTSVASIGDTASGTNAPTLPTRLDSASAVVASVADDSITWTPAVARTWVNVRADASRGGEVVGVLKPTTRAMLGADRAGWRLVKSPDVQGWVDPRLFEPDSLRTRGE